MTSSQALCGQQSSVRNCRCGRMSDAGFVTLFSIMMVNNWFVTVLQSGPLIKFSYLKASMPGLQPISSISVFIPFVIRIDYLQQNVKGLSPW